MNKNLQSNLNNTLITISDNETIEIYDQETKTQITIARNQKAPINDGFSLMTYDQDIATLDAITAINNLIAELCPEPQEQ